MTDKHLNSILLLAILVTIAAILSIHFVPHKKLLLAPTANARLYNTIEILPDGNASSTSLRPNNTQWECVVPESFNEYYFPCGLTVDLSTSTTDGLDLSKYSQLNLSLNYEGSANKIRVAIRNYNKAYSTTTDPNSTKFNAVHVHIRELAQETHIPFTSFSVGDWWLQKYNVPLAKSRSEINNAMAITFDFGEKLKPGKHILTLNKLELEGEWISAERWYLIILSIWMLGIFFYAMNRLIKLNKSNQQLQLETNKFRKLSTVDTLTQIYNRFGIDQIIASLTKTKAKTTGKKSNPLYALIIIDIDHFKRINDQRGHDVGDRVLQKIADIIQQHIRPDYYAGRWGGEEFVVIMPNTHKTTAMILAENIREIIFKTQYDPEKSISISASFGVGDKLPDEDFASCFKRIDNALYQAKHLGRNCCVYASDAL